MNRRITVVVALAFTSLLIGFYQGSQRAVAQDAPLLTSVSHAMLAVSDNTAKYVGSKKCKKCHIKIYKSWAETSMGKAFETLKPDAEAEIKLKFGLDPKKDYTTDAKCLECHTVGYGKPGGYATPNAADKKAVRKAKALEGVGCESCHGPGGSYIKLHKKILMTGRTYTEEEMLASGLIKPDESSCMKCHDGRGPTKPEKPFSFESMKDEGTHEHHPLKQRADS